MITKIADKALIHPLYADIARGVSGVAKRVIVGLNWTLVEGENGTGLAHTPARGFGGCHALPSPGDYTGQDLGSLIALIVSENVFEVSIAIAAANAHHNRKDLAGSADNGLDLARAGGGNTVIIGRFPNLDKRLPDAAVIERDPGPNDYPEAAAATLLPACEQLVITASTLLDGALPRLLALAPQAFTIVVGPGTPLAAPLFAHGVDALSGLVVDDVDGLARVVGEGGAVRAMKRHIRNLTLLKPDRVSN